MSLRCSLKKKWIVSGVAVIIHIFGLDILNTPRGSNKHFNGQLIKKHLRRKLNEF